MAPLPGPRHTIQYRRTGANPKRVRRPTENHERVDVPFNITVTIPYLRSDVSLNITGVPPKHLVSLPDPRDTVEYILPAKKKPVRSPTEDHEQMGASDVKF